MRFVVFGAGAIGGLVGARLFQAGVDVTLVARGAHAEALASGLVLESPDESVTLPIPVVTYASGLHWTDDTVVLLAVKGQHTEEALNQLVTVAPPETPIVCMQNGVENERRALRRFPRTYGMCVMCPASHLRPGLIVAHSTPVTGRRPGGPGSPEGGRSGPRGGRQRRGVDGGRSGSPGRPVAVPPDALGGTGRRIELTEPRAGDGIH
jgi:2-dehydropantoate 2-reductase